MKQAGLSYLQNTGTVIYTRHFEHLSRNSTKVTLYKEAITEYKYDLYSSWKNTIT